MTTNHEPLTPPMTAFQLRGVSQTRGLVRTLEDVDLDLPRGEVIALVGRSGAGKTTLLRLLNRLDDPSAGSIVLEGAPLASLPVRELRRRVAFVFQTAVMFPGTVAENLALAVSLAPAGSQTGHTLPSPEETLRSAGADASLLVRDAESLSGGERQRVGIARALMTDPQVLLLDEPTSALDPDVAERVMETIRSLATKHALTVVMITHRLSEARAASTHVVFMEGGRVVESGPTESMFTSPEQQRTREYLLREE